MHFTQFIFLLVLSVLFFIYLLLFFLFTFHDSLPQKMVAHTLVRERKDDASLRTQFNFCFGFSFMPKVNETYEHCVDVYGERESEKIVHSCDVAG